MCFAQLSAQTDSVVIAGRTVNKYGNSIVLEIYEHNSNFQRVYSDVYGVYKVKVPLGARITFYSTSYNSYYYVANEMYPKTSEIPSVSNTLKRTKKRIGTASVGSSEYNVLYNIENPIY